MPGTAAKQIIFVAAPLEAVGCLGLGVARSSFAHCTQMANLEQGKVQMADCFRWQLQAEIF